MDFFVQLSKKYSRYKLPQFNEVCDKVLNSLLENVPGQRLIEKFSEPEYRLMEDNFLVSRTVNHFKGLNNIILSTKYVNSASIYSKDDELHIEITKGKNHLLNYDETKPGNAVMIFQACKHNYQVHSQVVKRYGKTIYCN